MCVGRAGGRRRPCARGGAAGRRRQTALLMPLGQWAAFCCLFVWWVFVFVYLAASGTWDQVQT